MDAPQISRVTFTSEDRVRDVIHNFNADGFESLYPRYEDGRPPKFTDGQRDQIKRVALSRPEGPAVLDLEPVHTSRVPGR
jgi:transposase